MLFGRVDASCARHGYRSPDLDKVSDREERDSHPKAGTCRREDRRLRPAASARPHHPGRAAPDRRAARHAWSACTRRRSTSSASGTSTARPCGPRSMASTATIRRAGEQVHALVLARADVFPPQVLDAGDSFFAVNARRRRRQAACTSASARPAALQAVEIRVFTTRARRGPDACSSSTARAADPWMTLVGYFNALRELGGVRRMVDDDVSNRLRRTDRSGLARRRRPLLRELTCRVGSGDIPDILDQLGVMHDPDAAEDRAASDRRAAGDEHDLRRRRRAAAGSDGGGPAQGDGRVHPGDQPGRPDARGPGWSSRSTTGRGRETSRTTRRSSTTTPPSTARSRRCR